MPTYLPPISDRVSVLLVCTANICRSPMAEAVLRKKLYARGIRADIDSAGTHDYGEGMPPYPTAVSVAKDYGYDITRQVGRRIRLNDFRYFDLVVGLDRRTVARLQRLAPVEAREKVVPLLDYSVEFRGLEVDDPYGRGVLAFQDAFERIESGCHGLARAIERRLLRMQAVATAGRTMEPLATSKAA